MATRKKKASAKTVAMAAENPALMSGIVALADDGTVDPVATKSIIKLLLQKIKAEFVTQEEFNYVPIAINSFTNNKNVQEMGVTITDVLLSWKLNKTPTTLTLDGEPLGTSDTSKQLTEQNITTNKTWTLKATDSKDAEATKSTSITFYNGVYWGAKEAPSAIDSAFILTLTKGLQGNKTKTFTVAAAANQYIYYAVPSRDGEVSFNVGGFDGGFTKVQTLEFTNASGYSENYDVYRSDNASLGNTTVKCS